VPQFALGGIGDVFTAICSQLPEQPAGRGRGAPTSPDSAARPARGGGRGGDTGTPFQTCIQRRVSTPVGMHKTVATTDGAVQSNVDELYRLALGLENPRTYTVGSGASATPIDYARGWTADTYHGVSRLSAFGAAGGKRAAFVRIPDRHASIIILSNDDTLDARAVADRITDRLIDERK
jgi:CubicO group peptidase (beta-lactamase class C family)